MTITEQIEDFTSFARVLVQQQGEGLTLDDVYQKWKAIDPQEVAVLSKRLASYDAGERGRPADEVMADLRNRLVAKYGG